MLRALEGKNLELDSLIRFTEAAYIHLNADLIQTKYAYLKRSVKENKEELSSLIRESRDDALRLAELASLEPTIGFEASNHYYYSPRLLIEKALNADKLLGQLEELK